MSDDARSRVRSQVTHTLFKVNVGQRVRVLKQVMTWTPIAQRGMQLSGRASASQPKGSGSIPGPGIVQVGYGCTTHVVVPRRSDGTLNRGLVCVAHQTWTIKIPTSLRKRICDCRLIQKCKQEKEKKMMSAPLGLQVGTGIHTSNSPQGAIKLIQYNTIQYETQRKR